MRPNGMRNVMQIAEAGRQCNNRRKTKWVKRDLGEVNYYLTQLPQAEYPIFFFDSDLHNAGHTFLRFKDCRTGEKYLNPKLAHAKSIAYRNLLRMIFENRNGISMKHYEDQINSASSASKKNMKSKILAKCRDVKLEPRQPDKPRDIPK